MAEWLVEEGIGEQRAVRLENGQIAAARLAWPGERVAGQVEDAILASRSAGSARGTVRFADGEEALVDRLPRSASKGATLRVLVTRPAMAERGRAKLAQARVVDDAVFTQPSLQGSLRNEGYDVRLVARFPECGWDELLDEAFAGEVGYAGGSLSFSATPAMTLIDVDGTLPPPQLARDAVAPIAAAISRFDLRGSIGIDFPTLEAKADRQAVDDALGTALADWPHARTAMNGFGFVQLVARLERVSLLHRASFHGAGFAARRLLRRAEGLSGAGAIELSGHPSLPGALWPEWLEALARRTGREVRWKPQAGLALEASHAQLVPR